MRTAVALLLAVSLIAAAAKPPRAKKTRGTVAPSLDAQVHAAIKPFKGQVSLMAKNLDTGKSYELHADEPVRTASTIKLAIMAEAFAQVEEGKLHWTYESTLGAENRTGGSGVINEFSDGVQLPLRDLVRMMIVVSDNMATNLVLDKVGLDNVNARMEKLGFERTRSLRKIMGGGKPGSISTLGESKDMEKYGIGVSTPREMVTFMERLEKGELISPAASKEMLEILKRQQYRDGIGRTEPDTVRANKTGALDKLRSDVGILYTKNGRIAMAITVENIPDKFYAPDNPGLLLISKLSQILSAGLQSNATKAALH